jgi:hypothetical protein
MPSLVIWIQILLHKASLWRHWCSEIMLWRSRVLSMVRPPNSSGWLFSKHYLRRRQYSASITMCQIVVEEYEESVLRQVSNRNIWVLEQHRTIIEASS